MFSPTSTTTSLKKRSEILSSCNRASCWTRPGASLLLPFLFLFLLVQNVVLMVMGAFGLLYMYRKSWKRKNGQTYKLESVLMMIDWYCLTVGSGGRSGKTCFILTNTAQCSHFINKGKNRRVTQQLIQTSNEYAFLWTIINESKKYKRKLTD